MGTFQYLIDAPKTRTPYSAKNTPTYDSSK